MHNDHGSSTSPARVSAHTRGRRALFLVAFFTMGPAACALGRAATSDPDLDRDAAVSVDATTRDDDEPAKAPPSPELDSEAGQDAAVCPSPCGLAPQCGCAAFESCDIAPDAARGCTSSGQGLAGRACLGTFECARGLLCLSGVCRAPCSVSEATCTSGSCSDYAKAVTDGGPTATTTACAVACDYGDEASCGFRAGDLAGAGCVFRPELGRVECMSVRNVQLQSGVCSADAECGAGRVCVPSSMGFSSCKKLCNVGAADACGGCGPFPSPRVVGGVTFGYCP